MHACTGERLSLDWKDLADPTATLAVYIGRGAVPEISTRLLENGLAADTPVTVAATANVSC